MQVNRTLENYVLDVSSDSPAPGGGSVVAYMATLNIGLYLMSLKISIKRKKFQALDEDIKNAVYENIHCIENINKEILSYVDKDVEVFNHFMEAYHSKNEELIKKETIKCFEGPYNVLKLVLKAIDYMLIDYKYNVKTVMSDLRIAFISLIAILDNCKENIDINLIHIDDKNIHQEVDIAYQKINEYKNKLKDVLLSL